MAGTLPVSQMATQPSKRNLLFMVILSPKLRRSRFAAAFEHGFSLH
jgi:hypothetical protein